jgi:hypothetical protein
MHGRRRAADHCFVPPPQEITMLPILLTAAAGMLGPAIGLAIADRRSRRPSGAVESGDRPA